MGKEGGGRGMRGSDVDEEEEDLDGREGNGVGREGGREGSISLTGVRRVLVFSSTSTSDLAPFPANCSNLSSNTSLLPSENSLQSIPSSFKLSQTFFPSSPSTLGFSIPTTLTQRGTLILLRRAL